MAISPNVDFVAGAVLTATQQNQFPRGIMALRTSTTNSGAITASTVTIAAVSFTAVTNRYYRITYYEPQLVPTGAVTYADMQIIEGTTTAGTLLQLGVFTGSGANRGSTNVQVLTTFATAGTKNICAAMAANGGGSVNATRGGSDPAFLLVEDVGPA